MIKTEPAIISITHYGRKFTAELPCDSSIGEVCDALKGLLKSAGYAAVSYTHLTLPTKRIV